MVDIPGYINNLLVMSGLPVITSLIPAVRFSPLEKRTAGIPMDNKGHQVLSQHIHHVGLSRDIPHNFVLSWDILSVLEGMLFLFEVMAAGHHVRTRASSYTDFPHTQP